MIIFIGNGNSSHTRKWVNYCSKNQNVILVSHPIKNTRLPGYSNSVKFANIVYIIRQLFEQKKHLLVHVHYIGWLSLITIAFFPFKRVRIVVTPWGSDIKLVSKVSIKRKWIRFLIGRANAVICDSRELIVKLRSMGCKIKRHEIVMFGVDTNEFRKNIGGPRDISGTINIGSNRSHWPIYDVITLLKAAKILKRKNIES